LTKLRVGAIFIAQHQIGARIKPHPSPGKARTPAARRGYHEDKGERDMKEDLKKILFIKAMAALEAYQAAVSARPSSDETKIRHERFCAIWDIIETAGLDQEYETWKEG
jgi:hypothetical protein